MASQKYVNPPNFNANQRVFTIETIDDAFYLKIGAQCFEDQAYIDSLLSGHVQFIESNERWSAVVEITGSTVADHGVPLEKRPEELTEGCSYRIIFLSCDINVDHFDLILLDTEMHARDLK